MNKLVNFYYLNQKYLRYFQQFVSIKLNVKIMRFFNLFCCLNNVDFLKLKKKVFILDWIKNFYSLIKTKKSILFYHKFSINSNKLSTILLLKSSCIQ